MVGKPIKLNTDGVLEEMDIDNTYTVFPIWAEESGGLSNNNRQWSFGNGATGNINIVLPIDAELFAVSFDCENGGSGTASFDIMKNNTALFTTKDFTLKDFETVTPQAFVAGEYIGFRTNTETGSLSDARVCAWFRIPSSVASSSVLNDLLNVSTGTPGIGEVLTWNGSTWIAQAAGGGAVDSVNGQTGAVLLDTDDIGEGTSNLYYTDTRVTANPSVTANTSKVSADGSVTTHSDVSSAGSGNIITTSERNDLNTAIQPGDNVSNLTNDAGYITSASLPSDTDDLPEGSTNLYYTEARVDNNSNVVANTAKVSADGSVTTHSDVTNAGSGQIITASERSTLNSAIQPGDNNSVLTNSAGFVNVEGAQDAVAAALTDTDSITWNYNDAANTIEATSASGVFGQGAEDFINTTSLNFNNSTLAELRSFTTASKPTGRYRVAAEVTFDPHSTSNNVRFELRVDGVAIGTLYDNEHKDSGSDIREKVNLLGYFEHTGPGTFDIEIWGSRQSGGSATLHNVIAETWRVS